MKNADKFKGIFGIYATELWAKTEKEFLEWLNDYVPGTNVGDMIPRQAAIDALMARDKELRNINWYDKPYAEGECRRIDEALLILATFHLHSQNGRRGSGFSRIRIFSRIVQIADNPNGKDTARHQKKPQSGCRYARSAGQI